MCLPPSVREWIARIPLFARVTELHVEPLAGGVSLNNRNYRVDADGSAYVLRVGSAAGGFLGIRREEEIEAAQAAADAGIGPEILYTEPNGILLMPFIAGAHWPPEAFHVPANIVRIAETLRRLHSIRTVRADGSSYRRIERLLESAAGLGLELPPDTGAHQARLARVEQARSGNPRFVPGLSHNDFWANNFLDDGENLVLVDWEFSGTGDGLIDLATIAMGSQYTEAEQIALLAAYGLHEREDFADLQTMKWVVCFFEAAWALVQHGLRGSGNLAFSEAGDYNYQDHARRMFERLSAE